LKSHEANGDITYYRLDYQNTRSSAKPETLTEKDTQTLITVAINDPYLIHLRAGTNKGMSTVFSSVYIPPKTESK